MTLDQACAEIIAYSVVNGVDELTAIERMVKNLKTLPAQQRQAVEVFMSATQEPA